MSYLFEQQVGKHKYVYLIHGFRDKNGKVKQKRISVGKVDPNTGKQIFKPECYELLREAGIDAIPAEEMKTFSISDVKKSSVRSYGLFRLLKCIADDVRLSTVLKNTIPEYWEEILTLAMYMVSTRDPLMYCQDWLEKTDSYNVSDMSSQRISEILSSISLENRNAFYKEWHKKFINKNDYLALDITSVSSYSGLNESVEHGYNRDKEDLPQINLCMLMAEKTNLPLFQTTYSGSIGDISTLNNTIKEFDSIVGTRQITIITDKGFGSIPNISMLLDAGNNGKNPVKFLSAMPIISNLIKGLIDDERNTIDSIKNTIVVNGDSMRAVTRIIPWEGKTIGVHAHIYYNPSAALARREKVFSDVMSLYEEAKKDPAKYVDKEDYSKYINFIWKSKNVYELEINELAVEEAIKYSGWLVLLSNKFFDAESALQAYRDKDVVEKGFQRLKNNIDFSRLRVHGGKLMEAKLFIGFIATILMCEINKVMKKNGLYKKYTMYEMLKVVEKQHLQEINGQKIVSPTTAEQKAIYECFGINIIY